jgi:hypothetical protein
MTELTKRDIDKMVEEIFGRRAPPKPKVVVSDGRVVREAVVTVAPEDINARYNTDRRLEVRRTTLSPMSEADAKFWAEDRARAERERLRQAADPFGQGHWNDDNGTGGVR